VTLSHTESQMAQLGVMLDDTFSSSGFNLGNHRDSAPGSPSPPPRAVHHPTMREDAAVLKGEMLTREVAQRVAAQDAADIASWGRGAQQLSSGDGAVSATAVGRLLNDKTEEVISRAQMLHEVVTSERRVRISAGTKQAARRSVESPSPPRLRSVSPKPLRLKAWHGSYCKSLANDEGSHETPPRGTQLTPTANWAH